MNLEEAQALYDKLPKWRVDVTGGRDDPLRRWEADPPHRLHVGTPFGHLTIALNWRSRCQLWLPFIGYSRRWFSPIVWRPRYRRKT